MFGSFPIHQWPRQAHYLSWCWLLLSAVLVAQSSADPRDFLYSSLSDAGPVIEYQQGKKEVDFVHSKAPRVVEFYSPSCGACIAYAPKYVQLAKDMVQEHPQVEFYAVSCHAHRQVCQDYEVHGYPSLNVFPHPHSDSHTYIRHNRLNVKNALLEALQLVILPEDEDAVVAESRKLSEEEDGEGEAEGESEDEEEEKESEDEGEAEGESEDEEAEKESEDEGEEEKESQEGQEEDKEEKEADPDADEEKSGDGTEQDETGNSDEEEKSADQVQDVKEEEEGTSGEENDSAEDKESEEESKSDEEEVRDMPLPVAVGAESEDDGPADSNEDVSAEDEELENADGESPGGDEQESDSDEEDQFGKLPLGAERAKLKKNAMNKWQEVIRERKERLEKNQGGMRVSGGMRKAGRSSAAKARPPLPGITPTMKKNMPGTPEYMNRVSSFIDKIRHERKKKGFKLKRGAIVPGGKGPDEPSFKKGSMPLTKDVRVRSGPGKIAMKVPVLKGLVKMTPEEMLILDATLSFLSGLRHGVFSSNGPLDLKKKAALFDWLQLLSVSLPPEWGIHETIDDLLLHIDTISKSSSELDKVLDKHKYWNSNWSSTCSKGGAVKGFTCGFWKLLHIMSVGVAEHRGGLNLREAGVVNTNTRIFAPMEAAATVREYMAHFFGCTECRTHFIGQYDQCSFRRCERLSSDAIGATADDWKQLGLWLWEVHNDVNVRVAKERYGRQARKSPNKAMSQPHFGLADEVKVLVPTVESCLTCFESDGLWNEDGVFEFLETTYWASPDPKIDRLLKYKKQDYDIYGFRFVWFFMFLTVGVAYLMRNKLPGSRKGMQGIAQSAMVAGRSAIGAKKKHTV